MAWHSLTYEERAWERDILSHMGNARRSVFYRPTNCLTRSRPFHKPKPPLRRASAPIPASHHPHPSMMQIAARRHSILMAQNYRHAPQNR